MCLTIDNWIQIAVAIGTMGMAVLIYFEIRASDKHHKEVLEEMKEQRKPILKMCYENYPQVSPPGSNLTGTYVLLQGQISLISIKNVGFGPAENIELYFKRIPAFEYKEPIMDSMPALGKDENEPIQEKLQKWLEAKGLRSENEFLIKVKISGRDDSFWRLTKKDPEDPTYPYSIKKISKEEYETPFPPPN